MVGHTKFTTKVYNGSAWTIVGPAAAASTGNTGAIPDTIVAISPAATYVVLKFFIDNTLVGIWSKENSFTTGISGFGTINRGLNLSGAISQAYYGDADVAKNLKIVGVSIPAANFVRNDDPSDINASASREINGLVKIKEDSGLRIGEDDDLQVIVSGPEVFVRNATNNGNLVLSVVKNSVQTDFLKGNAISGLPEAYASPTASSNQYSLATKDYVDTVLGGGTGTSTFAANIVPSANLTYNLGSVSSWWNNIYGTAIHAQYADLAERFHADDVYDPGTIVGLGGEKEITIVNEELSEDVFGVISTRAAYLMNSGAGPDNSHPPVAVQGRVPVKVIGKIKKGERLVSAGNGLARAGAKNEISPWNVIGRSLEDKNTPDEGYVEAIVKLNS